MANKVQNEDIILTADTNKLRFFVVTLTLEDTGKNANYSALLRLPSGIEHWFVCEIPKCSIEAMTPGEQYVSTLTIPVPPGAYIVKKKERNFKVVQTTIDW